MDTETIVLPRAVAEALVDPNHVFYADSEWANCLYCDGWFKQDCATPDNIDHTSDCPVRITQEALKNQS